MEKKLNLNLDIQVNVNFILDIYKYVIATKIGYHQSFGDGGRIELKTIVFINSLGHSGSTIIDKCLGTCFDAFPLGEFINFPKTVLTDNICTCHQPINQCEFWGKIISEIGSIERTKIEFKTISSPSAYLKLSFFTPPPVSG